MHKEELKIILSDYRYDYQYLQEKAKEIEKINKMIKDGNDAEIFCQTRQYEQAEMNKIIEKKKYIESLLQGLTQPHRTIMYMKYVTFLTFDQIADKMHYSTKRIYQLHSEAMTALLENINACNNS